MSLVIGSKVKFTATNGHPQELAVASSLLDVTKEYTVNHTHSPAPFVTFLFLDDVPGHGFNTSMFEVMAIPCTEDMECISQ
jgi:hypothetical protein